MVQVAFNSFNPAIMQNMQAPAYTQNAQPAAAAKIYAPAHDEVVLTAKKPEEEKKTGKKLAIAAGAALGIAAIGLIVRGRLKAVTKLAEHIDFTPAKTMEEAREFARTHLKIKKFDTADDLEFANWVNEGLVNINNRYKGRAYMPKEVLPYPKELAGEHTLAGMASGLGNSTLYVNVYAWKGFDEGITRMLSMDKGFKFRFDPNKNRHTMICLPFFNVEKTKLILDKAVLFNKGELSQIDKCALSQNLYDYIKYYKLFRDNPIKIVENMYSQKNFVEALKKSLPDGVKTLEEVQKMDKAEIKKYIWEMSDNLRANTPQKDWYSATILDSKRSAFDSLYHEEGHLFHSKNAILDYEKMHVTYDDATGKAAEIRSGAREFLESADEQFIASTVSDYAKKSPLEFVAEVYARMVSGHKFGDDVMKLYEKYKGPKLPEAV